MLVSGAADGEVTSGLGLSGYLRDDYDGEHVDPNAGVAVLEALAPDRGVLIGSASKTLAPLCEAAGVTPLLHGDDHRAETVVCCPGPPALTAPAFAELIERRDPGHPNSLDRADAATLGRSSADERAIQHGR